MNGIEHRTLTKVYGLRFILSVRGEGRRFDAVHLFVAIGMSSLQKAYQVESFVIDQGSGVGYMIIAQIVCEFIFTTFHKHRKTYVQSKTKVCQLKQSGRNDEVQFVSIIYFLYLSSLYF